MPVASIRSRPVYARLAPRPGTLHLMVADHAGADAILDLAHGAPPDLWSRSHIIHIADLSAPDRRTGRLAALGPHMIYEGPSIAAAMPRLAQTLSTAFMGTQLYLAGTEGLIGQATKVALDAGMDLAAIQAEHRGSEARRVQCVHCKGVTEDVRTQPCRCAHCGLTLFVRDHYSRRVAAFQGVCIDAEEPGIVPAPQEMFR